MTERIPIFFYDSFGNPTNPTGMPVDPRSIPLGNPFIEVVLANDPNFGSGAKVFSYNSNQVVRALIDTGADYNYADPSLIMMAQCTYLSKAVVTSATESIETDRYLCNLIFPKLNKSIRAEVSSTPLLSTGRHYSLILGNSFLEMGTLHLDYSKQDFWFEFNNVG